MQPGADLRILLIRLSSLGDVVLTFPLARALRASYPAARIDFATKREYLSLVRLSGAVDSVYAVEPAAGFGHLFRLRSSLRKNRYTHVLDLHNNLRSTFLRLGLGHRLLTVNKRSYERKLLVERKVNLLLEEPDVIGRYFEAALPLGVADVGNPPRLDLSGVDHSRVDHSPAHLVPALVALCPGAKHANKQWPLEYWTELARMLVARGNVVEIFGSHEDVALGDAIVDGVLEDHRLSEERRRSGDHRWSGDHGWSGDHAWSEAAPRGAIKNHCGRMSLPESAFALSRSAVAVTNDSGLMHLASAAGVPVIALFGPTVVDFGFAPRADDAVVLENRGLYCRPCTTIGLPSCPEGHFRCMRELTVERVFGAIESLRRS